VFSNFPRHATFVLGFGFWKDAGGGEEKKLKKNKIGRGGVSKGFENKQVGRQKVAATNSFNR